MRWDNTKHMMSLQVLLGRYLCDRSAALATKQQILPGVEIEEIPRERDTSAVAIPRDIL
jgi:hypothetical protein